MYVSDYKIDSMDYLLSTYQPHSLSSCVIKTKFQFIKDYVPQNK